VQGFLQSNASQLAAIIATGVNTRLNAAITALTGHATHFHDSFSFEGRRYAWQPLRADSAGPGDFSSAVPGAAGPAVFYAAALVESPGERVLLKLSRNTPPQYVRTRRFTRQTW
jgi:hypothetical protein